MSFGNVSGWKFSLRSFAEWTCHFRKQTTERQRIWFSWSNYSLKMIKRILLKYVSWSMCINHCRFLWPTFHLCLFPASISSYFSFNFLGLKISFFFPVHLTLVAAPFHQICSFCVSSLSFLTTCPRFFLSNSFPLHLPALLYLLCFLLTPLDEGITFCCKLNSCWDREAHTMSWCAS